MNCTSDIYINSFTRPRIHVIGENINCIVNFVSEADDTGTMGFFALNPDCQKLDIIEKVVRYFDETIYKWTCHTKKTTLTQDDEFEGIVSEACIEFCNSHGLMCLLRQSLENLKTIFSGATNVFVDYDIFDDDENNDLGHMVFKFTVASNQEKYLEEYNQWFDFVADKISPHLARFITISPDRI